MSGLENSVMVGFSAVPVTMMPTSTGRYGRFAVMSSAGLSIGPLNRTTPLSMRRFWPYDWYEPFDQGDHPGELRIIGQRAEHLEVAGQARGDAVAGDPQPVAKIDAEVGHDADGALGLGALLAVGSAIPLLAVTRFAVTCRRLASGSPGGPGLDPAAFASFAFPPDVSPGTGAPPAPSSAGAASSRLPSASR